MWIGSASTKTPTHRCHDVVIKDPNSSEQQSSIFCDAIYVIHVIWQTGPIPGPQGHWINMLGNLPYIAFDQGIMGQPQLPQVVHLVLGAGGQHNLFVASWSHSMQFDMSMQHPHLQVST